MSARDIIISIKTAVDKKGLTEADKGLEGLGKKAEKTGGFFSGLAGKLGTLGDNIKKDLTGNLGPAGSALDKAGVGLGEMSTKTVLAGGAVAALGGFIAGGVTKLRELYDQTRDFNEVAGTTWEEGSRLIAVFDDLRVNAGEGASAMGKLTKTVGTAPEVLQGFGIEIAKAKDGTVDMAGTLENVATAFAGTTDPAKRAALGSALFGKSWQSMVPVLSKGGDELKKLIDGVDKSQVATEKGAAAQDKMFEASDNLHDAVDGLQRGLAENLIPTLAGVAENLTYVIDKFNDFGYAIGGYENLNGLGGATDENIKRHQENTKDNLEKLRAMIPSFGQVASQVGAETERAAAGVLRAYGPETSHAFKVTGDALYNLFHGAAGEIVNNEARMKDAKKAYDDFKKSVDDLVKQQEDMRNAQLETEDSSLAYEKAQIAAGDASGELSDKAKLAAEAVEQHGADSTEAKIATEEYKRSLLDARGAMDASADAAVTNATKIAEGNGVVLTAAEKVAIYRDEMIRLQGGAADPGLHSALQSVIDKYAELAAQAQNAAANAHGLIQAMNDAAGIERNFTGRDSSGVAVVRRAGGGPVAGGQPFIAGENGQELIVDKSDKYVYDALTTSRMLSRQGKGSSPTVTRDASGAVIHIAATQGSVAGMSGLQLPTLGRSPAGVPSGFGSGFTSGMPTIPGASFPGPSPTGTGGGPTYILNFYGITDIPKLIQEIKRVEAASR